MKITDKILESTSVRLLALAIGLLSASAGLLNFIFPNPQTVKQFSIIGVIFVAVYFMFVIVKRMILYSDNVRSYKNAARRYGIGYESMNVECIINQDGSAIVKRKAVIEAFSSLDRIETFLLMPERTEASTNNSEPINLGSITPLTPGKNIRISNIKNNLGRFSAEIELSPPLREGESVSYEMIEQLPKGLYAVDLAPEELAKRSQPEYDYFGWSINKPILNFSLKIFFPNFKKPHDNYGVEVRYTGRFNSAPLHTIEQERFKNLELSGPYADRYALKAEVRNPILNLIYLLRWKPL